MSERGSFVTQFIYCERCLDAASGVLLGDSKDLYGVRIKRKDSTTDGYRIIAGKIGGGYIGDELDIMERKLGPKLEVKICHPLRIAVLAESGEKIFVFRPKE